MLVWRMKNLLNYNIIVSNITFLWTFFNWIVIANKFPHSVLPINFVWISIMIYKINRNILIKYIISTFFFQEMIYCFNWCLHITHYFSICQSLHILFHKKLREIVKKLEYCIDIKWMRIIIKLHITILFAKNSVYFWFNFIFIILIIWDSMIW